MLLLIIIAVSLVARGAQTDFDEPIISILSRIATLDPDQSGEDPWLLPPKRGTTRARSCASNCTVLAPAPIDFFWVKPINSVTVTAVTVVEVIDERHNSTYYTTSYGEDFSARSTASDGRTTAVASYWKPGFSWKHCADVANCTEGYFSTTLTYPTPYSYRATEFTFRGTLPTSRGVNASSCLIRTAPEVFTFTTPFPVLSFPEPDPDDPLGLHYTLYAKEAFNLDLYTEAYPDEIALRFCSTRTGAALGPQSLTGTLYLTIQSQHRISDGDFGPPNFAASRQSREETLITTSVNQRMTSLFASPGDVAPTVAAPTSSKSRGEATHATSTGQASKETVRNDEARDSRSASSSNMINSDKAPIWTGPSRQDEPSISSSSQISPTHALPSAISIAGFNLTPLSSLRFVAPNGQTYEAGHTVNIGTSGASTLMLLTSDASGSSVLILDNTVTVPVPASATVISNTFTEPNLYAEPSPILIAGLPFIPLPSHRFIAPDGQTYSAGQIVTVQAAATSIPVILTSDAVAGSAVFVFDNTRTIPLPRSPVAGLGGVILQGLGAVPSPILVEGLPFTPLPSSRFVAPDGQTLTAGQAATIAVAGTPTPVVLTTDSFGSSIFVVGSSSTVQLPSLAIVDSITAGTSGVNEGVTSRQSQGGQLPPASATQIRGALTEEPTSVNAGNTGIISQQDGVPISGGSRLGSPTSTRAGGGLGGPFTTGGASAGSGDGPRSRFLLSLVICLVGFVASTCVLVR